jgi:hypothetical protein
MNRMVVSDVGLTQFTAPRGDPMADQRMCVSVSGNGGEGGGGGGVCAELDCGPKSEVEPQDHKGKKKRSPFAPIQ